MSNKVVTQNNMRRQVGYDDPTYRDRTFTAAAAKTYPLGTLLSDDGTGKLVVYVKGGDPAVAVLAVDTTVAAAGDVLVRPLVAGKCLQDQLIIDADGDGSNVDITEVESLRDFSIIVEKNRDLSKLES